MLLGLNCYGIVHVVTCGAWKNMGLLSSLISVINFLHKSILRFANVVRLVRSSAC